MLIGEEAEIGQQTPDSSSETTELRFRQETGMDTIVDETPADELTPRLVDERFKQATDPILRRVEELCARTFIDSITTASDFTHLLFP